MDQWFVYRRSSKGWQNDPPAKIYPNIMFGSGQQLTPEFVAENNITHVINCAFDEDCPEWFRIEHFENYYCLEAEDSLEVNILWWYQEFQEVLEDFIRRWDSKTIFVHCQCGINRSGFLCLMYACKRLNKSYDVMMKCILSQRPCALTNSAFKHQILSELSKNPPKE